MTQRELQLEYYRAAIALKQRELRAREWRHRHSPELRELDVVVAFHAHENGGAA